MKTQERLMRPNYYILDGHTPVACPDTLTWAKSFERSDRQIERTLLDSRFSEDVLISTVFLGLDHNWDEEGPPILFETMIFGGVHHDYQQRYVTWDEALEGHKKAVELARKGLGLWQRTKTLLWELNRKIFG